MLKMHSDTKIMSEYPNGTNIHCIHNDSMCTHSPKQCLAFFRFVAAHLFVCAEPPHTHILLMTVTNVITIVVWSLHVLHIRIVL